jgi:hypothetical protein
MTLGRLAAMALDATLSLALLGCSAKTDDAAGSSCATAAMAAPVPVTTVASDPPSPQGGTVAPGTYLLTDYTSYTGSNGSSGPAGFDVTLALSLDGTRFRLWVHGNQPETTEGTYTVQGTTLTLTPTCPLGIGPEDAQFTASGNSLKMFEKASSGNATIVSTLLLQCNPGTFPGMACH